MFYLELDNFGNNVALYDGSRTMTYSQLEKAVSSFAQSCNSKKSLVAMEMEPNIGSIVAYLGYLRANWTIMMVDAALEKGLKDAIYKQYKPDFIYSENIETRYSNVKSDLLDVLALMLPTSGSTGSFKYVRLSKENLHANTKSIVKYLPLGSQDVAITNLPLYYSYGLSVLHTHLSVGASVVLSSSSILSKEFWELFDRFGVTNFNGVPYHYEMLKKLGFLKKNYSALRFMTQAGGKLNEQLVKSFATWSKEHTKEFYVMYGQTEATARISYLPPDITLQKPNSIGLSIPGGELFLQDTKTPYKESQLCYRGPNVMLGYATKKEDLKKQDEQNAYLETGDVGYIDREGYFYITSRASRFIKLYGSRINLDEIEQFLKTQGIEVVVVGKEDTLIVYTQNADTARVKAMLIKRYTLHHRAVHVENVNSFAYKSNGKFDYQKMLEQFNG